MLKIEKHVIRLAIMLGAVVRVGYAADIEAQLQSELESRRARLADERKKIETQFANCKLCKGLGVVTQKMTCETCGGGGVLMEKKGSFSIGKPCPKCKNKGYLYQRKICWKCRPYDVQVSREKPQPTEAETKEDKPKCDTCKGKGRVIKEVPCSACHGQGGVRIPAKRLVTGWSKERWSKCGICNASGKKSVWEKCSACNGKGATQEVGDKNGGKEKEAENSKPDVVKWIQYSAEKGNANAQYCLGVMCAAGDSVQKDMSNAVKWLSKASEQRHVEAQSLLLLAKKVNENMKDVNGIAKNEHSIKSPERQEEGSGKVIETQGKSPNVDALIKQGLARNASASDAFFQRYKFDFAAYHNWRDDHSNLTKIQRNEIFDNLTQGGYKSSMWKDYCYCHCALIPDGVKFVVKDVVSGRGGSLYFIRLNFQDKELEGKLNKEYFEGLIGYFDLCIMDSDGYEEVEKCKMMKKGDVLVSDGWVCDIAVANAVRTTTYQDGTTRKSDYRKVDKIAYFYRSIDSLMDTALGW